jgi:hypothetical protein
LTGASTLLRLLRVGLEQVRAVARSISEELRALARSSCSDKPFAWHSREGRDQRRRAEVGDETQFLGVEPAGGLQLLTHWRGLTMLPGGTPASFSAR